MKYYSESKMVILCGTDLTLTNGNVINVKTGDILSLSNRDKEEEISAEMFKTVNEPFIFDLDDPGLKGGVRI